MAIRLEFGAEPIPGYRLVERLGGGGFGEVWKAEAPGGLYKAIKFVYGDLQSTDDGSRAEQELKALSRVKTVHHPFILSLERYDIINGQLMIVMELADRTIWDRFKECRQEGMPGIPREELLGYLRETAEALDLMNMQFQLQHLDIKPQNLFLVFNHIKVADFGLVKDLGTMAAATITGGVTPVYAAPETFDGWLSRFSDQYSLAIVYQELLTGIRPFQGATMRQLVMQHLQSPPNVTPLPAGDRAPVTKALSKNPDERFPTCIDFIKSLYYTVPTPSATSTARGAPAPAKSEPAPALPARPTGAVTSPDVPPAPAPEPPKSVPKPAPNEPKLEDKPDRPASEVDVTWKARRERGLAGSSAMIHLPEISFQPPPGSSASVEVILRTDGELKLPARPRGKAASASKLDLADPNASRGVIQPAVVLGLGQLGMDTLLQFRRIVAAEFGQFEAAPHLRLLGLDTDPDTIREFGGADASVSLRPSEMLCLRLQRVNQYLAKIRGDGKLPTEQWLSTKVLYRITKENAKAAARPLGRFALVNHIATVSKRIESEIQACVSGDTLTELAALKDLGTRSPRPRVYVVANLAGASGGGMFIDAAYLARKHLRALGHRDSEVVGVFYVPSTSDEGIRGLSLANAYAALSELRHFNEQGGMKALYGSFQSKETIKLDEAGPPFDRCVFLPLPKGRFEPGTTPEVVRLAAQTLFRDLATSMGRMMDRVREHALEVANEPVTLESIGLRTLRYPRADLVRSVASRFAGRLVDRWKSKDASSLRDSIGAWARETWDTLGLRPEALIDRYLELAAKSFKKPVEKVLQETIQPALGALARPRGR